MLCHCWWSTLDTLTDRLDSSSSAQSPLHQNPFVETTLSYLLTYISLFTGPVIKPAQITILADDSYYTTPSDAPKESFKDEQFKFFGVPLWEAHKTGLGSSAALVTALSAALLSHYLPSDKFDLYLNRGPSKEKLHRLAQSAHCAAQGKVGSGFDVASAVYGSCVYRRFSPQLLIDLGTPGSDGFAARLRVLVDGPEGEGEDDPWDAMVSKEDVSLPKGLRLAMCDVDCGSQTPGMVKQVLAWRKKEPYEANMLWNRLHQANQSVAKEIGRLASTHFINKTDDYVPLTKAIELIRELVRDMSRLSDVPIEPDEQRGLLDACSQVEGVVGGVVPGAGGYDAIALIIEDSKETVHKLQAALDDWNEKLKGKENRIAGKVSLLDVREDDEGVRLQKPDDYTSWILRRSESIDDSVVSPA